MISRNIREFYSNYSVSDDEIENDLKNRIRKFCKPCWELKICPYGPLVEDFPLPGIRKEHAKAHIKYLKECIEKDKIGSDFSVDLDEVRKKLFLQEIAEFDEGAFDDGPFKLEEEMSCKEFGHLCPVFFVSEPFTETKDTRNRSRNISYATKVRVARRDNNICQICGRQLLDREIEFDHIIPFSKGGSSAESNIRVTCHKCNRKRGNKTSEVIM